MAEKIKLKCRLCGRTKMARREKYVPSEAVIEEVECPKCAPESWCQVRWFDAAGKELNSVVTE